MTKQLEQLKQSAREANRHSYSPYSQFKVSAALRGDDGNIYSGVNVENASFGLSNCAERSAIFSALSAGASSFDTLVIYTPTATPVSPCGACRQVISEFAKQATVISICDSDQVRQHQISELLPADFDLNDYR
ncbi:MAG: cytidine deaminase [Cellvibrionaceae bacterium]|nr:cytidine deaminase [Cellvibrionaceae bacterium]